MKPTNTTEIEQISSLIKKRKECKAKKRYDTVPLHLGRYKNMEIVAILHIPEKTVSTYMKLYKRGGITSLLIKNRQRSQGN